MSPGMTSRNENWGPAVTAVSEVYQFANTIPPGTAKATPATFPMILPLMDVVWIEWEVPPGARGNVGFWIGSHGQPIIPFASGPANWIVTDGREVHWDTESLMDSGDWQMAGYNVGQLPHTVTVRFGLTVPAPGVATFAPISNDVLSTI
jgi:hypothetical protein